MIQAKPQFGCPTTGVASPTTIASGNKKHQKLPRCCQPSSNVACSYCCYCSLCPEATVAAAAATGSNKTTRKNDQVEMNNNKILLPNCHSNSSQRCLRPTSGLLTKDQKLMMRNNNNLNLESCSTNSNNCAKCQLLARWASAQAQLTAGSRPKSQVNQNRTKTGKVNLKQRVIVPSDGDEEEEVSSLELEPMDELNKPEEDKWSLDELEARADNLNRIRSSREEICEESQASQNNGRNYVRVVSLRRRRLALKLAPLGLRKRRPAPMPPAGACSSRPKATEEQDSSVNVKKQQQKCLSKMTSLGAPSDCGSSGDSGNTSGAEQSATVTSSTSSSSSTGVAAALEEKAEKPQQHHHQQQHQHKKPNLLSEPELVRLEHFLKSHKSSIYVCGCMANLYLTSTRLVDNGRCSEPTSEGWQLSRTGVPVLSFDSGLVKNRPRRRLSINLTERDSGFVLWSDIIDHLSNYRAYSSMSMSVSLSREANQQASYDAFHVMYLSSNHRLMVGLSFDDPHCARLFLRQVELVTSDPANLGLTGPSSHQLGRRLGGLARLFACGRPEVGSKSKKKKQPSRFGGGSQQQRERPPSAQAHNSSWSTLKRAIRFNRNSRDLQEPPRGSKETQNSNTLNMAAYQPKPLALLAHSGRTYGPRGALQSRPLPRKCDISAPCLFQHVTQLDQQHLQRLYSGSLVARKSSGVVLEEEDRESPKELSNPVKEDSSNTSSCYSSGSGSGSVSPTSSECGANERASGGQQHQQLAQQQNNNRRDKGGRPPVAPPQVPQRTSSCSQGAPEVGATSEEACEGNVKIQAIIRELEAQTSVELVDAKRRLMADISHRMLAARSISHL